MQTYNQIKDKNHSIIINDKKQCLVNGITKIESITSLKIILKINDDFLAIAGENLEVVSVNTDKGELEILGNILFTSYLKNKDFEIKNNKQKESFLVKLFK